MSNSDESIQNLLKVATCAEDEPSELLKVREVFFHFLENTPDFIYIKDAEHRFLYTSNAFARLVKHNNWRNLVGKTDFDIFPAEHARVYYEKERSLITMSEGLTDLEEPFYNTEGELCWVSSNKRPIKDETGQIVGLFGISRDITEKKRLTEELERLANYDYLTGLLSRRMFIDEARHMLELARRNKWQAVCFFIDLDDFKPINDEYGHDMGDAVLIEVAKRIRSTFRESDLVCRLGGDEFLVLALVDSDTFKAETVCASLNQNISETLNMTGSRFRVSASIGLAYSPDHAEGIESLITLSDKAMYSCKGDVSQGFCISGTF